MKFLKNKLYFIRLLDHWEGGTLSESSDLILNVVGRFLERHGKMLIFDNWWFDDSKSTTDVRTFSHIVESAILKAKRLD